MPSTYTPITSTTLSSAQSSITFSSISGTYTDLILAFSNVKLSSGDSAIDFQVGNGSVDTGSNYDFNITGARSSSATPFAHSLDTTTLGRSNWFTAATTSQAAMSEIHFINYSNTTTFKSILANSRVEPGSANYSGIELVLTTWRSTSAINVIKIMPNTSTFTAGSIFTLYGIKAA